jgi:aspartate racemase
LLKTLGIIGGLGPESTVDYYQTIIRLYRERIGGDVYPRFLINNVDLTSVRDPIVANDLALAARNLISAAETLARAGTDLGMIAANTPHIVFDEVAQQSQIPLISIVEATAAAAKDRQLKRLAIFGTKFTMNGEWYARPFARAGIELVRPAAADQDYIHDKYMNELVSGEFLPETKAGLLAIVDRIKARSDIDAVVLAGTELPLILREPGHNGIGFLNTTRIHCQAAVEMMFS